MNFSNKNQKISKDQHICINMVKESCQDILGQRMNKEAQSRFSLIKPKVKSL